MTKYWFGFKTVPVVPRQYTSRYSILIGQHLTSVDTGSFLFTTGNLYGLRRLCRDLCHETEPTQILSEIPRPKYFKNKSAIFALDWGKQAILRKFWKNKNYFFIFGVFRYPRNHHRTTFFTVLSVTIVFCVKIGSRKVFNWLTN